MASRAVVILEDDLTGEQLEAGRGETISFGLDGHDYEIDLSGENATELRQALGRYTGAARKTGPVGVRAGGGRSARRSTRPRRDTSAIRAWARENGHEVSERGRVPSGVLAAYDAAH